MSDLADLVRAEMSTSGRYQNAVAHQIGVSDKHMSQMLTGKVRMSFETAEAILAAIGRRLVIGTIPLDPEPGPAAGPRMGRPRLWGGG